MRPLKSITSMAEAFEAHDAGEIDAPRLDDAIWLVLTGMVGSASDLAKLPGPVADYYASRYLQFEVGNGGFAQAAYNIPDYFGPAAKGYRARGLPEAAALIDKAALIVEEERAKFDADDIGDLFEQFEDSELADFDEELDDVGFWADESRLAHVLRHRDTFLSVG